ncbi:hypothetical protein ACFL34_04480 [Candidatus Sumerlaeota bacterium]
MKKFLVKFWRDEQGQALPFFTVFSLIMAMSVIVNYNVGQTVSEKMRAQCVADSAVYTASAWQARFLNFCAYTRRAIVANWCAIAQMNVILSNKRMFETIANERIKAKDQSDSVVRGDDGKEKKDEPSFGIPDQADIVNMAMTLPRTLIKPSDGSDSAPDFRQVADQMNRMMSNAQVVLFHSVVNPEPMMKRVIEASGQPGWTAEFELVEMNTPIYNVFGEEDVSLSRWLNPNMELDELLKRDMIPIDEVRWQFDNYTLPLFPTHAKGASVMAGRKWQNAYWGCCDDDPFWMSTNIKWANMKLPIGSPFKSTAGIIRPYADIMDNTSESGTDRSVGRYIVSHEGKGKHEAERDTGGLSKILGMDMSWTQKCIKCYEDICCPILHSPRYSGSATEPYELQHTIQDVKVYEMKDNLANNRMEPSVYAIVRRPVDQIGYLRLLQLENPHDILAIARAKVNFVSPDENLASNTMSEPNLNYPFWTACLAPVEFGRNFRGLVSPLKVHIAVRLNYEYFKDFDGFRIKDPTY